MEDLKKCSDEEIVFMIKNKEVKARELTDSGICPTCFNKEHNHILYGDIEEKLLYEDEDLECFLDFHPKSIGHEIISSKKHYKESLSLRKCIFMYNV